MRTPTPYTRRGFIAAAGIGAGALLSAGTIGGSKEEEVSANEDLMREHGLLDRVLLIYEEALRRIEGKKDLAPDALATGAGIVRRFIEDYHEKLEEDFLFIRFEKAGKLRELVSTLRAQHQAGRRLTDAIRGLSTSASSKDEGSRRKLAESLRLFVRMYRPHAAREDTVLFPALHHIVSRGEYDALGEKFEDEEHRLFGEGGFEKVLDQVVEIERQLDIHDLVRFTPA